VLVGLYIGLGLWWINTTLAYPVGILLAYKKDLVENALKKYYWFLLLIAGLVFFFSFASQELITMNRIYQLILMTVSVIAFILLILNVLYKIRFKTKIFTFLRIISYELFLIHSSFFEMIFDGFAIENSLFIIPVLLLIVAVAYILYRVDSFIFRIINKNQITKTAKTR